MNRIVSLGDSGTFTCSAEGGPNNSFQWQRDGQDLTGESGSILTLTNVNAMHGGDYSCLVSNAAGNDSATATLYIQPYIVTQPMDMAAESLDNVTFLCQADGFPTPNIIWERVSRVDIVLSPPELVQVGGEMLVISPVTFTDAGIYRCVASASIAELSNLEFHDEADTVLSGK